MADKPNRFVDAALNAEIIRGFDRNMESWRRADRNVAPEHPPRDRPLMPNVAELAGEHRGEKER